MALPVQSIRATHEHRDILQAVADLLRQGREREVRHLLDDASARSVGVFRDEAAALAFLRDRLVACLRPRIIWLFGSRARGEARPDSDSDLLVVLPDGLPAAASAIRRLPRHWWRAGFPSMPCRQRGAILSPTAKGRAA